MDAETFTRVLRAFTRRMPFQSFTVEFVSGESIAVEHPEALVYRAGTAVYFDSNGIPTLFDHEGVSRVIGEIDEFDSA